MPVVQKLQHQLPYKEASTWFHKIRYAASSEVATINQTLQLIFEGIMNEVLDSHKIQTQYARFQGFRDKVLKSLET